MARVIAMILPGPYRIPAYAYDVSVFLTTKCPAGPMRAPMASCVLDHGGNDRRDRARACRSIRWPCGARNSILPPDLPFVTVTGETYVDVTPRETLEAAVAAIDYDALARRSTRASARAAGLSGSGSAP